MGSAACAGHVITDMSDTRMIRLQRRTPRLVPAAPISAANGDRTCIPGRYWTVTIACPAKGLTAHVVNAHLIALATSGHLRLHAAAADVSRRIWTCVEGSDRLPQQPCWCSASQPVPARAPAGAAAPAATPRRRSSSSGYRCRPRPPSGGSPTATPSGSSCEDAGYQVDLQYAGDDIPTQSQQVDQMITQGADAADHRRHRRHRAEQPAAGGRRREHPGDRLRPADPRQPERRLLRHLRQLRGRRRSRRTPC